MKNGLTLDELIVKLQNLRRRHGGDDEVMVHGLYASSAYIEKADDIKRVKNEQTSHIVIFTDICSG